VFVFEESHNAARRETVRKGPKHSFDVGLVHEDQPTDHCVKRLIGRGSNVAYFESNVGHPELLHPPGCSFDVGGFPFDADNRTGRRNQLADKYRNIASARSTLEHTSARANARSSEKRLCRRV
jgi:hypothetical protein